MAPVSASAARPESGPAAAASTADTRAAHIAELQQRARALKLADSPEWHALLHRQPRFGLFGGRSLADSDNFFLSSRGRTDTAAELDATLAAFADDTPETDTTQPPQCRFVARRAWLDGRLQIDRARLPWLRCPRFDAWLAAIDPGTVTLVFASAYLNSPSSAYGHTLLRIDPAGAAREAPLLAYSVNYAADTDGSFPLLYALRGLAGGYQGRFTLAPYYAKVAEYNDAESRDLWEYTLTLDPAEVRRLLEHVWELGPIGFDYYFLDENCASYLLALIEVARPSTRLGSAFTWWAIPADTVRAVAETPGLVARVAYRPSRATALRHRLSQADPAHAALANDVAASRTAVDAPQVAALPEPQRAEVLDLAFDTLDWQRLRGQIGGDDARPRLRALLLARAQLDGPAPTEPPIPSVRPDEGHRSLRLSAAIGTAQGHGVQELRWRPAYHDPLDPDAGYLKGGAIDFLEVRLRHDNARDTTTLERFTLADVTSLAPRDALGWPTSFRVGAGLQRVQVDDRTRALFGVARVGGGKSLAFLGDRLLAYGLLEGLAQVSPRLRHDAAVGPGASVGAYVDATPRWRLHPFVSVGRYLAGDVHSVVEAGLDQRLTLSRDFAFNLEARWRREFGVEVATFFATLHWYR